MFNFNLNMIHNTLLSLRMYECMAVKAIINVVCFHERNNNNNFRGEQNQRKRERLRVLLLRLFQTILKIINIIIISFFFHDS